MDIPAYQYEQIAIRDSKWKDAKDRPTAAKGIITLRTFGLCCPCPCGVLRWQISNAHPIPYLFSRALELALWD